MDDKKLPENIPDDVPAWVRGDPEVLADWLATDWEAEAKLYDELGRRRLPENQALFIGGWGRRKPEK